MKTKKKLKEILLLILSGILAGTVNGLFGTGGGILLVPLLSKVSKIESKKSHATTLACVLFMCLSSGVVYFIKNQIDYKLITICLIGSLVGAVIGSKLLKNLKNGVIDIIFNSFLIASGILMIV